MQQNKEVTIVFGFFIRQKQNFLKMLKICAPYSFFNDRMFLFNCVLFQQSDDLNIYFKLNIDNLNYKAMKFFLFCYTDQSPGI